MGVHAAVRHHADQVQAARPLEHALPGRASRHRAVIDGVGDAHQVLFEDAARSQREVADLGVAELPVRQADGPAGGLQRGVRIGGEIMVEVGSARQGPGVVRAAGVESESVEDGQ